MTILPWSSTPQLTGEACGPPSFRVVITIAWCLTLMNSISSSLLTTVFVAIFLATSVYPIAGDETARAWVHQSTVARPDSTTINDWLTAGADSAKATHGHHVV